MATWNATETPTNVTTYTIKLYSNYEGAEGLTSKLFKSVALGVLMLMSLTGNSLVIASVVKNHNKRMRTVSNLLIVNTSLSYFLITVVNIPELIYNINSKQPFLIGGTIVTHLCRLKYFAPFLSVTLATQSFAVLSVDRFIAVFYPLRRITHKVAYILIALTWVTSVAFGGVYLFGSAVITHPKLGIVCVINIRKAFNGLKGLVTFVWIEFSFFYIFPLILASALYTATIIRLWKPKINREVRGPLSIRFSDKTNKNAIKMLTTVLVLFTVAWLPLWVYTVTCRGNLKNFLGHPICSSKLFVFLTFFIGYSHGAFAPYVYPIFSQNFRAGFKNCCSSLKLCKDIDRRVDNPGTLIQLKALTLKTASSERGLTNISIDFKNV